jgi:hypothetical protein
LGWPTWSVLRRSLLNKKNGPLRLAAFLVYTCHWNCLQNRLEWFCATGVPLEAPPGVIPFAVLQNVARTGRGLLMRCWSANSFCRVRSAKTRSCLTTRSIAIRRLPPCIATAAAIALIGTVSPLMAGGLIVVSGAMVVAMFHLAAAGKPLHDDFNLGRQVGRPFWET